jgi:hypothetical protein
MYLYGAHANMSYATTDKGEYIAYNLRYLFAIEHVYGQTHGLPMVTHTTKEPVRIAL